MWRGDGRDLYYWEGEQVLAVMLNGGEGGEPLQVREPRRLSRLRIPAA